MHHEVSILHIPRHLAGIGASASATRASCLFNSGCELLPMGIGNGPTVPKPFTCASLHDRMAFGSSVHGGGDARFSDWFDRHRCGWDAGGLVRHRSSKRLDRGEAAAKRGIHLTLCSGRPAFGTALEYARRLEANGWHIFQNGASIVNLATRQSRSVSLPPSCVKTFIAQARESAETLELYSDDGYVTESSSALAQAARGLAGRCICTPPFRVADTTVLRAQWLLSADKARQFMSSRISGWKRRNLPRP